jgi:transcription initiation factor TFIID subunit TAF12
MQHCCGHAASLGQRKRVAHMPQLQQQQKQQKTFDQNWPKITHTTSR